MYAVDVERIDETFRDRTANRQLKIEQRPTTQRPTPIGDSEIEQRGESEQKGKKKKNGEGDQ